MRNWDDENASISISAAHSQNSKSSSVTASKMDSQALKITPSSNDLADGSSDQEKKLDLAGSTASDTVSNRPFDQAATKKLLRKLDLHLIPFLSLIYLLCFLDRTNVGNARLAGLEEDLHLKGLDYNIALAIMFPFYIIAEIPSNMMIKRFRPSIWLTIIMVSWSLVMICMGFVQNFAGLLVARSFLGLCEAGLYPGVSYFITMWYRREECGTRMAFFFSAATVAGAFGGLLARGINEMSGVGGYSGWRWIFILEGLMTLLIGSISFWVIKDYPATANFLTPEEKTEVERRLAADSNGLAHEFHIKYVYQALRDWKIWVNCVIALSTLTALYSIALFLPTIIKDLGYKDNEAQLLTVPPYVFACFVTVSGNYIADKMGRKGIFILGFQVLALVGFILLISSGMPHVQYAGTFLAAAGIYTMVPMVIAWNAVNIGGSLKRGVGIAMQVSFGSFGGIIASFVYISKNGPRFIQGHAILIGFTGLAFILTAFMTTYLGRENARRDALMSQQNLTLETYSNDLKDAQRDKGDDATFFRYTV